MAPAAAEADDGSLKMTITRDLADCAVGDDASGPGEFGCALDVRASTAVNATNKQDMSAGATTVLRMSAPLTEYSGE
jgi:hypothetical protein